MDEQSYRAMLEQAILDYEILMPELNKWQDKQRALKYIIKGLADLLDIPIDEDRYWYRPREINYRTKKK